MFFLFIHALQFIAHIHTHTHAYTFLYSAYESHSRIRNRKYVLAFNTTASKFCFLLYTFRGTFILNLYVSWLCLRLWGYVCVCLPVYVGGGVARFMSLTTTTFSFRSCCCCCCCFSCCFLCFLVYFPSESDDVCIKMPCLFCFFVCLFVPAWTKIAHKQNKKVKWLFKLFLFFFYTFLFYFL